MREQMIQFARFVALSALIAKQKPRPKPGL